MEIIKLIYSNLNINQFYKGFNENTFKKKPSC